jgi:hypothetical protein
MIRGHSTPSLPPCYTAEQSGAPPISSSAGVDSRPTSSINLTMPLQLRIDLTTGCRSVQIPNLYGVQALLGSPEDTRLFNTVHLRRGPLFAFLQVTLHIFHRLKPMVRTGMALAHRRRLDGDGPNRQRLRWRFDRIKLEDVGATSLCPLVSKDFAILAPTCYR